MTLSLLLYLAGISIKFNILAVGFLGIYLTIFLINYFKGYDTYVIMHIMAALLAIALILMPSSKTIYLMAGVELTKQEITNRDDRLMFSKISSAIDMFTEDKQVIDIVEEPK